VSSSPALFFARLFGPGVEFGYRPIRLPKLHIVAVDKSPGGFDGGLIVNTIQSNHANSSVVYSTARKRCHPQMINLHEAPVSA
jgi:hypothetical protein